MSDISTIKPEDMNAETRAAYDLVVEAVETLRRALVQQAIETGTGRDGDDCQVFLRYFPQSVGMKLTAPKAPKASGFAGLKRPETLDEKRAQEAIKLAQWQAEQRASGRRY